MVRRLAFDRQTWQKRVLSLGRAVIAVEHKGLDALAERLFGVGLDEHRGEGQVWLREAHHSVGGNRLVLAHHQHDWSAVSNSTQDLDKIIWRKMTIGRVGDKDGFKTRLIRAFQTTERICHHCENRHIFQGTCNIFQM